MPYDKDRDPMHGYAVSAISPGRIMELVTPDDDEDFDVYAKALRVETEGTIAFLPVQNADADVVTLNVTAGEVLDFVQVRRVLDTGTTADMVIWAIRG